ncbi:MinD/ParA family ATP-binding protein [Natronocalculus amylovorans]|uniref:P-loop NTPase n=1 Tax=Natronocalculus amylovorans TaxID=2917812 RepID=A0AAE3K6X3_9EURY|nr:P-loop NTPase [Natronocalculus amylovorans]MCL9815396.1 P-loop NTPase [Natronocalculus amylovorans]
MAEGVVIAIAGAKGGVGKTTTAVNLGVALAQAGERVAVLEFDLAMANIVDFLDIEPTQTMHTVLSGTASVTDAVHRLDSGVDILPAGTALEDFNAVNVATIAPVVRTLKPSYDFVILDTAAGVSPETIYPLRLADEVLVVSTPRVAAVRDTKKTIALAERVNGTVAGVIFNRCGTGHAPPPERLAAFLETDLVGAVPNDSAVPEAQDRGEPVVTYRPKSDAATEFFSIADSLIFSHQSTDANTPGAIGTGGIGDLTNAEQIADAAEAADPGDTALKTDDDPDDGFQFVTDS